MDAWRVHCCSSSLFLPTPYSSELIAALRQPKSKHQKRVRGRRAGTLGEPELRAGVRCLRLRLYTRDEAAWALSSGYIDLPWLEPPPPRVASAPQYAECVRKDAHSVYAARRFCGTDAEPDGLAAEAAAEATGVSAELRRVVSAESAALRACIGAASAVLDALVHRGVPGIGEMIRELDEM